MGYCLLTLAALAALVVTTGMSAPILSALHAATGPNAGGMCVYGSLVCHRSLTLSTLVPPPQRRS